MTVETSLITADEFEAYIHKPEHAERHLELIHGEIIEDMPTEEHGMIVSNIHGHLWTHVRAHKVGRVVVEVRRKADDYNVRLPDVDFTSNARLQDRQGDEQVVRQGPVSQMPDLAVEVQSPGQSDKLMSDKADFYLANGTRLVWLVYPRKRLVEVRTIDDRQLLSGDERLTGGDVLPEFSMTVDDVFEGVDDLNPSD